MEWPNEFMPFTYFIFIIWRTVIKDGQPVRKIRVIMDIRGLNKLTISDAYLFLK
jgi:hypothetical protein